MGFNSGFKVLNIPNTHSLFITFLYHVSLYLAPSSARTYIFLTQNSLLVHSFVKASSLRICTERNISESLLFKITPTLSPNWQKESWQTFEETSGYVRPERVNKWPSSMTDIWWWWWWWWWRRRRRWWQHHQMAGMSGVVMACSNSWVSNTRLNSSYYAGPGNIS